MHITLVGSGSAGMVSANNYHMCAYLTMTQKEHAEHHGYRAVYIYIRSAITPSAITCGDGVVVHACSLRIHRSQTFPARTATTCLCARKDSFAAWYDEKL